MGAGSAVELQLFGMEKETAFAEPPTKKLFERRRSFRDIQGVISKINPEVVKAVIASGSATAVSVEKHKILSSPLPLLNPFYRPSSAHETGVETAPLTIFYNGTVAVFDVPHQQAENIIKVAEEAVDIKPKQHVEKLNGSLPLTRRKSLRRFLEKRKGRQMDGGSTYGVPPSAALPSQNASGPADYYENKDTDIIE